MNKTIFQFFHWYNKPEDNLWQHAAQEAHRLASLGITQVWLPPAYKSFKGVDEPGYAVYDLFDLGEFDQKGTVRTKYGTKEEYLGAIEAFHQAGVEVIADIVLNHKMGGDENEEVEVQTVNAENRLEIVGEKHVTETNTKYTFPGRQGKYSNFIWDKNSFSGFKQNEDIKIISNEYTREGWEEMVGNENGNYDYLMGKDIEFRNPHVREELKNWGRWYTDTTKVDGFRLDALKHISPNFYPEWIDYLKNTFQKDFTVIGEYWKSDAELLSQYIDVTEERIALFDVPLHFNFHEASRKGKEYDMRKIFNNSLIRHRPNLSVPFVDNHDTQPLQALESTVDMWFKPLAYALILLRKDGFPCVFYPSIYGGHYSDERDGKMVEVDMPTLDVIQTLLKVRRDLAYGDEYDYFDHENVVGFTRTGTADMPNSGIAVLMSNGDKGEKVMSLGKTHAGKTLVDVVDEQGAVMLNEEGIGLFKVSGGKVSVWVDSSYKL